MALSEAPHRGRPLTATVVLRSAAVADVEVAYRWYEAQRPGLGGEFLNEVEACLERISERPLSFPAVINDARRALLRRFPYSVYFRLRGDEARVLALLHQARDPRLAQKRSR